MSVTQLPRPDCLYGGQERHITPLCCPRISQILIDEDGNLAGLVFKDDYFDAETSPENPDAA